MSIKEMETTVRELRELRRMKEELDSEIANLEDTIKAEMTNRDVDTLIAGEYKVKWTAYESSRFDATRFKKEHADLAAQYVKITSSRRFTIA